MDGRILVAGGTGTVGRVAVAQLIAAGARVRVLSRGRHWPGAADAAGQVERVVGDVRTGAGLAGVLDGVDTVLACLDPLDRLVPAAIAAGKPHVVSISIVGVDRVPFRYYRGKLADERLLADSGLPWTVLRTTQFHDLIATALGVLAKSPLLPVPAGFSFQPIDVAAVGARLAELARGRPAGRVADMGGPQVLPSTELARQYLAAAGKRRPVLPVPVPGRTARAFRSGYHLAPDNATATITFEQYLSERFGATSGWSA